VASCSPQQTQRAYPGIMNFSHLKLTDWPFQIVPDPRFYTFMADRSQVQTDIENLLRIMARRDQSSIHLVWAWFGSGKTHTMRHFCYLCRERMPAIQTVYTEFPKSVKSFLDLYKAFAQELDLNALKELLTDLFTTPGLDSTISSLRSSFPDLEKVVRYIVFGNEEHQLLAMRWLKADNIPLRDLRSAGVGQRLETIDAASRTMSWISQLIGKLGSSKDSVGRLIWVIDEFQLISECRQPTAHEIMGSLHSLFNKTPTNFTLFISFSGRPEKRFPAWLSRELSDRIGIEKVILLPPLANADALRFIQDLLAHFRQPGDSVPRTFPFQEETVHEVLDFIQQNKTELKPRILMQAFGAVLEEAEALVERGEIQSIEPGFARKVLQERLFHEGKSIE